MQLSIKAPGAVLWRTGVTEEEIRKQVDEGSVTGEWMICPLGEAGRAVTVEEFLADQSIFAPAGGVGRARVVQEASMGLAVPEKSEQRKGKMSMAGLGWWVFFGALLAYLVLTTFLGQQTASFVSSMRVSAGVLVVLATVMQGVQALIVAGAVTAILGHALPMLPKRG